MTDGSNAVSDPGNFIPKAYLVTGAAGFIGSNISLTLSAMGHEVIVCDRFRDGRKWKNLQGARIAEIVPPEKVIDWIGAQADNLAGVIHMGAISATTETDVDKIILNNFRLSSDLWFASARFGLPFIYASSAATYGDGSSGFDDDEGAEAVSQLRPLNPYGWSKLLFDQRVIAEKGKNNHAPPQWAGLRFFNVYGPNEHHKGDMRSVVNKIFPEVNAGRPVTLFKSHRAEYADGGQLRDFVYVDDCVKIIMWLLENKSVSGLFNIGTSTPRSFADLVRGVGLALNKEPKIDYVDMPEQIRNSYQYFTKANIRKLRDAGYAEPFHSLEDGIADYIRRDLIGSI